MELTYKNSKTIDSEQLKNLYNDVGWTAYTKDIELLQQALLQSLEVVSAWDNHNLVGLIRIVGDGLTIIYIQDILVLNEYQNKGIASQLIQDVMSRYESVRQKVLLTEEAPDVRHFYEKQGFQSCDKGDLVSFAKLN
ncbi:GNAT family N-acetyltransferase [Viridibacillus arvi]|uniref:GNAT family N-acetyltransferase n=1 Tax=Viridibacillus arvi TaxID=263475 RepID=UPI0036CDF07E